MRISDWSSDVCSSDFINRRSGLPRHHVAPCDKGWTAKRTSRHQKGGRTMTHHGLTRLAALLATGVATSCFMTVPANAQETRSEERRVGKGCVSKWSDRWSREH